MNGMDKRWADAVLGLLCATYPGLARPRLVEVIHTPVPFQRPGGARYCAVFRFDVNESASASDVIGFLTYVIGFLAYVLTDMPATIQAVHERADITWRWLYASPTEDT